MDESIMENNSAKTQTMHIAASGMTTIALSGNEPITDSTGLVRERKEFTVTGSCSHIRCILDEMTEEHANQLIADFSDLWKERTVEELGPGIFRVTTNSNSNDGSTGPLAKEVEPLD